MYCEGCLHGSINYQLTLEEQALFYKMVMFSAVCGGQPGVISDNDGRPMPHWFIANELHAPLEVFKSMLAKCVEEGRLQENSNGIVVTNFDQYQSEYLRQKPSRERRKERTQAEEEKVNLDNKYNTRIREEMVKYEEEHDSAPIGDDWEDIKHRVNEEVYGADED